MLFIRLLAVLVIALNISTAMGDETKYLHHSLLDKLLTEGGCDRSKSYYMRDAPARAIVAGQVNLFVKDTSPLNDPAVLERLLNEGKEKADERCKTALPKPTIAAVDIFKDSELVVSAWWWDGRWFLHSNTLPRFGRETEVKTAQTPTTVESSTSHQREPVDVDPSPFTDADAIATKLCPHVDWVIVPTGRVTVVKGLTPLLGMVEGSTITEEVYNQTVALQKVGVLTFTEDRPFSRFRAGEYLPIPMVESRHGIITKGVVRQTDLGKKTSKATDDNPSQTGIRGNVATKCAVTETETKKFDGVTYVVVIVSVVVPPTPEYNQFEEVYRKVRLEPDRKMVALLKYDAAKKEWVRLGFDGALKSVPYNSTNAANELDRIWSAAKK
jgi:hypothetical protein